MSDFIISSWHFSDDSSVSKQADRVTLSPDNWYHCQRDHPQFQQWLHAQALPQAIIEALLEGDTRPRFEFYAADIYLINLRSVNLNEGSDPDDMLSLRLLFYRGALISTCKKPSKAISAIIAALAQRQGPDSVEALIVAIIDGINKHILDFLTPVEEQLDDAERADLARAGDFRDSQGRLLSLRRYLKPQLYVLEDMLDDDISILQDYHFYLKNSLNNTSRINESIEFYLEQINLFFTTLNHHNADRLNKNAYFFTLMAGVFLPAAFFTGLFGVNLGGIPGVDDSSAFPLFFISLVMIIILEIIIIKKYKLL